MGAYWENQGNTICRVYRSGAVRQAVPYLEYKIERTDTGYKVSHRFTDQSCLMNKKWRNGTASYSNEFAPYEVSIAVTKLMMSIVKQTFSHLDE